MADISTASPGSRQTEPLENDFSVMSAASRSGRRPVVLEPDGRGDLLDWLERHGDVFEAHLASAGAVLFRRFPAATIRAFEQAARRLCGDLVTGNPEHTPVSADGSIQTPVAYAADRMLLWHNENSFNDEWPSRIAFCCLLPAAAGGETPIVDSRLVYREVDPEIRAKFISKGVAYVRNFGSGLGVSWRAVFGSEDRETVERYCQAHHLQTEWNGRELARTIAVRPAVVKHPLTGESVWFNQAQHWHPSCLDADIRAALERGVGADNLPRNCVFGDGEPIPDEYMRHLLDIYRRHQIVFPWRQGDVLALDNLMWAHGRNPYRGRRAILVAMGNVRRYSEIMGC